MKNRIMVFTFVVLVVFLGCQQQQQSFELEKIDARQKLDNMLQEIDDQIKALKLDTLKLNEDELKSKLYESEKELADMRSTVLDQLNDIESVGQKNWDEFKASVDSSEVEITQALERAREYISTLMQRPPTVPPAY